MATVSEIYQELKRQTALLGRKKTLISETTFIGATQGAWVITGASISKNGWRYWPAHCSLCGIDFIIPQQSLLSGHSNSCRLCSITKHGGAVRGNEHPLYKLYQQMVRRCTKQTSEAYRYYGARGIKVCPEWLGRDGFTRFVTDVGNRPSAAHSLDRKDNNGNYEPSNVHWATHTAQMRNRRNSVMVKFRGKSQCLSAWCEELSLNRSVIGGRISRGMDPILALAKPIKSRKR